MTAPKAPRRGPIPQAPRPQPHVPTEWEPEDAYAVQAVMRGVASEEQQRRAMRFLVERICGAYDLEYRPAELDPDGRASAFAGGKRFVGLQLIKFANLNIAQVRGKQTEQGDTPKEQPT